MEFKENQQTLIKQQRAFGEYFTFLVAASPITAISNKKNKLDSTNKGFKINAGERRLHGHIKLKGVHSNILVVKVSGSDNEGKTSVYGKR